ncbi:MAG: 3-ketoacyl-ACP reductase [Anaerolineae bacterium]|nr:3-ketoacyl-ACP reductase [Anaerolineae bacterium]
MNKVVLITGAGRGIGLGIALTLANEGCDIAIMDIHDDEVVISALNELRQYGGDILYCKADVTDSDARLTALEEIKTKFGRLNVLVNNAGVGPKIRADILDATEESYDWVMDINLKGPYFLTQAVANYMIEQQRQDTSFSGTIVNISSISSTVASPSRGEYCISKAGVSMATQLWAVRLAEFNIPVYEIRPGIIQTAMTAVVKDKYDKLIAEGLTLQPRWGIPDDIGRAVGALVRGDFPYSTGQVIMVDGGLTVQRL